MAAGRRCRTPSARTRTCRSSRRYVQDVIRAHRDDPRVLWWETYNEPNLKDPFTVKLRELAYGWAKEVEPLPAGHRLLGRPSLHGHRQRPQLRGRLRGPLEPAGRPEPAQRHGLHRSGGALVWPQAPQQRLAHRGDPLAALAPGGRQDRAGRLSLLGTDGRQLATAAGIGARRMARPSRPSRGAACSGPTARRCPMPKPKPSAATPPARRRALLFEDFQSRAGTMPPKPPAGLDAFCRALGPTQAAATWPERQDQGRRRRSRLERLPAGSHRHAEGSRRQRGAGLPRERTRAGRRPDARLLRWASTQTRSTWAG